MLITKLNFSQAQERKESHRKIFRFQTLINNQHNRRCLKRIRENLIQLALKEPEVSFDEEDIEEENAS